MPKVDGRRARPSMHAGCQRTGVVGVDSRRTAASQLTHGEAHPECAQIRLSPGFFAEFRVDPPKLN